ncbi:hypothetical protein PAXRUDRAFT_831982 [Paxillus rubicundulus Ve08.2h10]|uniref:Uncharacterized protein n=1 Tax=Paxillus rubicundulus Ve08.2h10 TaxID=930991 RepID=A0A0D0CPM7_9AGAM|nr:hypothetical protein PAXRUDRAFT_831982 [Paxillus rubicundulus Ve08.2h10]
MGSADHDLKHTASVDTSRLVFHVDGRCDVAKRMHLHPGSHRAYLEAEEYRVCAATQEFVAANIHD